MCKLTAKSILLKFLFFIFIYSTLTISSRAGVNLNDKWSLGSDGLWYLSFTPSGSFDNLGYTYNSVCIPSTGTTCIGGWRISISGGAVGSSGKVCYPLVEVSSGKTFSDALQAANQQILGNSCTIGGFNLDGNEKICIYSSLNGLWNDGYNSYPGVNLYGTPYGCSGGLVPPIPPLSCTMNDIIIDHGTVNLNELNNSEKSIQSLINCNRKATVKLTLSANGRVILNESGSLYSTVSINGMEGQNTMTVDDSSPVIFSSKISYIGDDQINGDFSGSLILVMDFK